MLKYFITPLLLFSLIAPATAQMPQMGQEVLTLDKPTLPIRGDKKPIEVVAIFSYGCGYCYNLEPYLNQWVEQQQEQGDITFIHLPVPGEGINEIYTKTYLTLLALKKVDKGHQLFFDAVMKRTRFTSPKQVAKFMAKEGVATEEEFLKNWDSFTVKTNYNKAIDLVANQYHATHTPILIVDGRYFLDISTANSITPNQENPYQQTITILNRLVEEIRSEREQADSEEAA